MKRNSRFLTVALISADWPWRGRGTGPAEPAADAHDGRRNGTGMMGQMGRA